MHNVINIPAQLILVYLG